MAERRMFAKTIIDSDVFIEMPSTTQNLYFHLGMRADDDGVVNNPKSIMRMVGAKDDDLKILLAKKYVLPLDNGLVVIKHWKINNFIQSDRYVPSKYKELLESTLLLDSNNAYTNSGNGHAIGFNKKTKKLTPAQQLRLDARNKSDLPSSFDYKIRNAFVGEPCPICGCTMSYSNNLVKPTIQHNKPISLGGKHEIDNISVICSSCNSSIQNHKETPPYNTELVKKKWSELGNVSGMDTQVSIGKVSIGKVSKESLGTNVPCPRSLNDDAQFAPMISETLEENKSQDQERDRINYQEIANLYNSICLSFPKCTSLSDKRKAAIRARFKTYKTIDKFKELFIKAEASDFLKGANNQNWSANFDWLMCDSNFAKTIDGNYDNKSKPMVHSEQKNNLQQNSSSTIDTKSILDELDSL